MSVSGAQTLLDVLQTAEADGPAIFLPERGIGINYDCLRQQVHAMADTLAGAGIQRGDRIAMALPNGLPAIVTFLAPAIAGTASPPNPAYRHDEFCFYLEDTSAGVLLCPENGGEDARQAAKERGVPVLSVAVDDGGGVHLADAEPKQRTSATAPEPDDIALILHTSGSTGRPKRVPLKHRNLASSARTIVDTYTFCPDDVALCVMPLFHVHGLVASTLSTLLSGGAIAVPPKFNALSFWRTVRDTKASWYSAVPTIHNLLLARAGNERPAGAEGLRFIRSCSA